jgi:hypothetical protein
MGESDDEIGDAVHPADALLERDSTARYGERLKLRCSSCKTLGARVATA